MTEREYIEATNLAKVRIAADTLSDVMAGYGPITPERLAEITRPLSRLLDDCFAETNTKENTR